MLSSNAAATAVEDRWKTAIRSAVGARCWHWYWESLVRGCMPRRLLEAQLEGIRLVAISHRSLAKSRRATPIPAIQPKRNAIPLRLVV